MSPSKNKGTYRPPGCDTLAFFTVARYFDLRKHQGSCSICAGSPRCPRLGIRIRFPEQELSQRISIDKSPRLFTLNTFYQLIIFFILFQVAAGFHWTRFFSAGLTSWRISVSPDAVFRFYLYLANRLTIFQLRINRQVLIEFLVSNVNLLFNNSYKHFITIERFSVTITVFHESSQVYRARYNNVCHSQRFVFR